jgi:2,4-dienoyl-CoA reductase (NADPH2)
MERNLSALFQPLQINTMNLRNRIVMAPMHSKFSSETGEVTDRLIEYHAERSKGGVGLIVLENTCVDWEYGRSYGNPVTIHDDICRSGLSNLTLAVQRYGAKIVTQLQHVGRQNVRSNIVGHKAPLAPSAVKSKVGGDMPRPLEENEILRIIQQFVDAARRTKQAGFDGVELHGAHGYIFTQFFSPYTNKREDRWGGRLENRARFPLEVVRRIRAEVGPDFPILYRLSAEERVPGGTTLEDTLKLVKMLDGAGVDCFDVSAGIYESMEWFYLMQGMKPGALVPLANAVKGVTSKPVIGVGRLGWDLELAAQFVREKKLDLVNIGRSLLADPHLVRKAYQGRTREIRPCIACNDGVAMENKGWQLHCTVNPMLGNEYLDPVKPTRAPKNVVVIGGGPAGMECALISAQRGHAVTLVEGSSELGGQLRAAAIPDYKKEEMTALIAYYEHMLEKSGVKVTLGTEIKDTLPRGLKADVVVVATGAVPATPSFKGSQHVMSPFDVLLSRGKGCGQDAVVIGGSGVGIDTALFLMEKKGRKVTVVEMLDEVGGDINDILKGHVLRLAEEKGIEFLTNTEAVGVDKGRVHVRTLMGEKTLTCNTVVSAVGFVSRDTKELRKSLEKDGIQCFVIGSAQEPGKIFEATQSGFWNALEI